MAPDVKDLSLPLKPMWLPYSSPANNEGKFGSDMCAPTLTARRSTLLGPEYSGQPWLGPCTESLGRGSVLDAGRGLAQHQNLNRVVFMVNVLRAFTPVGQWMTTAGRAKPRQSQSWPSPRPRLLARPVCPGVIPSQPQDLRAVARTLAAGPGARAALQGPPGATAV